MISATAPAMTDDVVEVGRSPGGAAEVVPVPVALAVTVAPDGDGVVSPSELDALPRSELAKLHTWRMLFTSEGKLGVSRTAVWFVLSKQSAHCGKTDLKVSVQEHLITLMNSPGLRMTEEKLASAGAASAHVLIVG
jgi:hypothetical protein